MRDRFVFFDATLLEGGAERVISILSAELAKQEPVEILLYFDSKPFYYIPDNVKITYVCRETGKTNIFVNLLWMRRYFNKNAKAVISFLAPFNMLAIIATLFSKTKIIVADRNDPRKVPTQKFVRSLRNFLYRFADGVVVQTQRNNQYFSRCIQRKSTVIANPIDLRDNAGTALTTAKRHKIVAVGRLIAQKNPMMLLRAFTRFVKCHPDYELVCYGEGNMRSQMETYIRENALQEKVFLPGSQKDIFHHIKDAEFYIMSSNYEGMPNALMEAMCLGLPVISTRVSGAEDYIIPGENGLLVDVGDEDGLLQAMETLANDPKKREALGRQAVNLNKVLEVSAITKQWLSFIEAVSDKR